MARRPMAADAVADLFQELSLANARIAEALDQLIARPYPASTATVIELEHMLERIRPAASLRDRLAILTTDELLAGAQVWDKRRRALRVVPDGVGETA